MRDAVQCKSRVARHDRHAGRRTMAAHAPRDIAHATRENLTGCTQLKLKLSGKEQPRKVRRNPIAMLSKWCCLALLACWWPQLCSAAYFVKVGIIREVSGDNTSSSCFSLRVENFCSLHYCISRS